MPLICDPPIGFTLRLITPLLLIDSGFVRLAHAEAVDEPEGSGLMRMRFAGVGSALEATCRWTHPADHHGKQRSSVQGVKATG